MISKKYDEAVVEKLIETTTKGHEDDVRGLLRVLFPACEPIATFGASINDEWARDRRIAHPDFFDRYFLLAIPAGDVSQEEVEGLLSKIATRDEFVAEFLRLKERGLETAFLRRLDDYKDEVELRYAESFVAAMFDVSTYLDAKLEFGTFEITAANHVARIIYWYLLKERNVENREEILHAAITSSNALHMPTLLVMRESTRREKSNVGEPLLAEASLGRFKELCSAKIRAAANEGRLIEIPELSFLLYWWGEWTALEEPRAYLENEFETPQRVLRFLVALLSPGNSSSHGRFHQIRPESIKRYSSFERQSNLVEKIDQERINRDERIALLAFDRSMRLERGDFDEVMKKRNFDDERHYVFDSELDDDGRLKSG